jgi:hypothetical protein
MGSPLHLRGTGVQAIVQLNGKNKPFRFSTLKVDEEMEDGYDQVGGEKRGTPWRETNGFKLTYDAFAQNRVILAAWMDSQKNDDALLVPFNNALGVVFRFPDGTRQAYKGYGNVTLGPMSAGYGSRTGAVMLPSYLRMQYFEEAKATI